MIVSFTVSNFRSISSEQTLSLVASKRVAGKHEGHTLPIPKSKESVLKAGVIYGANGAGKSNLFKALKYVKSMVLNNKPKSHGNTGRQHFKFDTNSKTDPSLFDLQFIAGDSLYRYGFKADDSKILEEWLIKVGVRDKVIYERITNSKDEVIVEIKKSKASQSFKDKKIEALATVGGRINQLFLSTVFATLEKSDLGSDLAAINNWFSKTLNLIAPNDSASMLGHQLSRSSDFLKFAGHFLKSSSTGVDYLETLKKEITEEELNALLPAQLMTELLKELNATTDESATALVQLGEGNELLVERKQGNHFFRIKIQAMHSSASGEVMPLDLFEESDGTRRLLNLMPALHHLKTRDAVYFIDEIDRSMHPLLVWKFLEFFLNSCDEGQRQIIVTTHETNLLDLELLRRDEIWFTEKDDKLSTHFYSLTEFKVRNDLEIKKHYLQGRFGAIPFMGNFDNLPLMAD